MDDMMYVMAYGVFDERLHMLLMRRKYQEVSSTCWAGGKGRSHDRRAELENAGVKYIPVGRRQLGPKTCASYKGMPKIIFSSCLAYNGMSIRYSTGIAFLLCKLSKCDMNVPSNFPSTFPNTF